MVCCNENIWNRHGWPWTTKITPKKYDPDLSKVIMAQNRICSKYQIPSKFGNLRKKLYEANLIRSKPIRE